MSTEGQAGNDKVVAQESTEAEVDMTVLLPGPDAKAEPYHAIMEVDEAGNATGQLWAHGGRLMLFESVNAAKKVLTALADEHYQLRGVSQAHLHALQQVTAEKVELYVVIGFTPAGKVEALPLEEHRARKAKAGSPPPLPPAKASAPAEVVAEAGEAGAGEGEASGQEGDAAE